MILGTFTTSDRTSNPQETFRAVAEKMFVANGQNPKIEFPDPKVAFSYVSPFNTAVYLNLAPVVSPDREMASVFSGQIYNKYELADLVSLPQSELTNINQLVVKLYQRYGAGFVEKLNGKFAYAIWDKSQQCIVLGRDRLGIEPLYYSINDDGLCFSSKIEPILSCLGNNRAMSHSAVSKFLLFGYNPGAQTFYKDVRKLPPATMLKVRPGMTPELNRYWELRFDGDISSNEATIAEELRSKLQKAVEYRMEGDGKYGVFVSGGMDSSSVLGLSSLTRDQSAHTFSYRCRGDSYDESPYARLMAKSVNSVHQEIEYTPSDVFVMQEIAARMDEPICDIGINIATYILGRAAHESVPYVLTGDGGDELLGGHPVYEADKIARYIDPIPGLIKRPLFALADRLPDSDQKKNLTVKIKRFAESLSYPSSLFSHRWRIYYKPEELQQLLSDSAYDAIRSSDLYEDIHACNAEATGLDLLNRSLYSDYFTVVDFYLRRNDINRMFGLETRYPLLDHELVEYCAKIPTDLKIKGWFDTKYILKKSMESVLPREIVHREDKLGHSIPLKNWMRDKRDIKEFILDHVSESSLSKRGLFRPDYVNGLVKDHMDKRRNNSHRIWTLAVLEMWMRHHVDSNL